MGGPTRLLVVTTVTVTARNFLIPYARHFRDRGWRVEVACRGAAEDPRLAEAFDEAHDLPLSRSILDLPALLRGERAVARLVASPDLVHVHTPIAGFVTRLAVRLLPRDRRPAVVYTTHGFHFHRGGSPVKNRLYLLAESVAGRWTDRLIVINDEDEAAARANRLVPARRLVRMPGIGIDTARYARDALGTGAIEAARAGLGVPDAAPMFVVVGELNPNKRTGDAIRALAAMPRRDAILVLAGEGRDRERLGALAEELGVAGRVRFPGFVDDVRPVVAAATALLLPSEREGLSRSIMEALALEVPVVASNARGNAELVDAKVGYVLPVGDVRGLAAAMERLADEPVRAAAMGARGRSRVVARYDLPLLLRRHEELYAELLAERAGPRARRRA